MKHFTTSGSGIDCILWHLLFATGKHVVDSLMAEYSIANFAADAVYLSAVWSKCLGVAIIVFCFMLIY